MRSIDLLGILVAIGAAAFAYMKWRYQHWQRKNVPVVPELDLNNLSVIEKTAAKYKYGRDQGWKYCGTYSIFGFPLLIITDLDILKNILSKDFDHFVDRGTYVNEKVQPISAHLFAIGGKRWEYLRKKFSPTFTSGKLKMMFQVLIDNTIPLEKALNELSQKKEVVNVKDLTKCYTVDVIGSCGFGLDCNSFTNPDSALLEFDKKVFKHSPWKFMKEMLCNYFPDIGRFLGFTLIDHEVDYLFTKMIKETVSYRDMNHVQRIDFLQMMMDMREKNQEAVSSGSKYLTIDQIVAQCFVFFVGGFETTNTLISFGLMELSAHEDVQEKARKEIIEVLKRYNDEITYESLQEMNYLKQVINELLRMYAPIGTVERICVKDYKVPDTDLVIEKNTRIVISIHGIHYDEKYHKDPKKFNPDRFSKENKENMHEYAHIPFGKGPRACLGMRFGFMESMVALITVLRKFKVKLSERTIYPIKFNPRFFFARAEGDIWLEFEKIDN